MPYDASSEPISKRFIEGLQEYNLTLKEIQESGWKYAGGDENAGPGPLNYFVQMFGNTPEQVYGEMEDYCICGHPIKRHYFITDANEDGMLVIGSECIKRFLPENVQGRTCAMCMAPHRRTKNTICFDCEKQIKDEKKKLCVDCGGKKQPKFKRCYECFNHLRRQRYYDYLNGGGYDW